MAKFGVFGRGLVKNNALLPQFLQAYRHVGQAKAQAGKAQPVVIERLYPLVSKVQLARHQTITLLGWGRKKSYQRAARFAAAHGLPMLALEDGFLRSLTSGKASRYACSLVLDPIGMYFDSTSANLLETLIIQCQLSDTERQYCWHLIGQIITERLSKYNASPKDGTLQGLGIDNRQQNILLVDQVAGDQSITGAGASAADFEQMLVAAGKLYPQAVLWVKAHPAGKQGYLSALALPSKVRLIDQPVNPIELLQQMDAVLTVSSHMGFEALLLGKRVHCFGMAWYAGFGLTEDSHIPKAVYQQTQARRRAVYQSGYGQDATPQTSVEQLFYAAYLQYSAYANPATAQPATIEAAINWLVTNREWRDKLPHALQVVGFSRWKYGFVRSFLATTATQLTFIPNPSRSGAKKTRLAQVHLATAQLRANIQAYLMARGRQRPSLPSDRLVWGWATKSALQAAHGEASNTTIWCMEDGFIRSNGLGASLIEPLSVVIDKTGIYYNATAPSDLETLLSQQGDLTEQQHQRVQALMANLLSQAVSKYNVGTSQPLALPAKSHKILVVGQVEDDMSVRLCASDVTSNLELLKSVRAANPTAYIVYKPHPDVQAGLRQGKVAEADINRYADKLVTDIAMPTCLAAVDAVHTISSLTGFEALLRGREVVCYGLPFYAGFGLTYDLASNVAARQALNRRQRATPLTLEQLVYASLIRYPLYRVPHGFGLAQVEDVIAYLYPQGEQVTMPAGTTKQSHRPLIAQKNRLKLKLMQWYRKLA